MPLVEYNNDPKISDTVSIRFQTTDENDEPLNPYQVDKVTIYFLERNRFEGNYNTFFELDDVTDDLIEFSYTRANPIKVYGNEGEPAWFSPDTSLALIEKLDFDEDGNSLVGQFRFEWTPELAKEGDYFVCWTWTPIVASIKLSNYLRFYLNGNTQVTTSTPSHYTVPGKYEDLLETYLPDMYKNYIAEEELTPTVIDTLHRAVAKGFSGLEDSVNQIIDLMDGNVVQDSILPYLANMFSLKLRSQKPTLWRRQIKTAVPLFKQKGTYNGLKEALDQSGIKLTNLTQYWQIASSCTYQESFKVQADQDEFTLTKTAILPIDPQNFEIAVLFYGDTEFIELTSNYVALTNDGSVTTMTWEGLTQSTPISLEENDIIRVLYKIKPVVNQTNEYYIRDLPLLDLRDPTVCYPKKNWNIHVIAETDVMFTTLCANRHPYKDFIVFGKIRTEFPYSENIYNMEEYNGSTRDSMNPCDIDLYFLDECSACLSSSISVDVECFPLSNDKVVETEEIIKEFIPFHAVIHSINFNGGIEDFLLPPVENLTIYMRTELEDKVLHGNIDFNRSIQPNLENYKRDALATATSVVTATDGIGYNVAVTLYYPELNWDQNTMGLDLENNYLEILSGLNQGVYTVENPNGSLIDVIETVPSPFEKSPFPFRLSNKLFEGSGDIYQDDVFVFGDVNALLYSHNIVLSSWKVHVLSGPYAGSYTITEVRPDNTIVVSGWGTTSNTTGLSWELRTDTNVLVDSGSAGAVSVVRRGRVETAFDIVDEYGVVLGNYVYRNNTPYEIIGVVSNYIVYIDGWTGGNVVGATLKYYKRIVNNGVGYIYIRGMKLTTTANHYNILGISNDLDDDNHVENYLVLIDTNYYQISSWSNIASGGRYDIVIKGTPLLEWGFAGTTGITYSLIQFEKKHNALVGKANRVLDVVDRRGRDIVEYTIETNAAMSLNTTASLLNSCNSGKPLELIEQLEKITFKIEYLEDLLE
jgi:hypothetical protein